MSAIQNYAMQLWNDLRARRLVPVAVLLVAGLIAAPVVLSKKAEEPPASAVVVVPTQAKQQTGPEELAKVKLEDAIGKGNGSSLSAFDASNPFSPPDKVLKAAKEETQQDDGTANITAPTDTGTGTPTGDTGGDTGGGTDNGTGGGGGGGGTTTTEFAYVIDATFWTNDGKKKTLKGMEKLDVLPDESSPLLIFMGVTDQGGNAVFLVDSTLSATGEGSCKPSADDCGMLQLGPGSEERFTNDIGDSYRLRIDQIRKVKVSDQATASRDEKADKQSKSARAAVGSGTSRRFVFPMLTDLVVESGTDDSTLAEKRR